MTTNGDTQTYEGWTNYETWLVNLWIENDEASYLFWRGETARARDARVQGELLGNSLQYHFTTWRQLCGLTN